MEVSSASAYNAEENVRHLIGSKEYSGALFLTFTANHEIAEIKKNYLIKSYKCWQALHFGKWAQRQWQRPSDPSHIVI